MSSGASERLQFEGSWKIPAVFLVAFFTYRTAFTAVEVSVLSGTSEGPAFSFSPGWLLLGLGWVLALLGTTAVAFRREGLSIRSILPSPVEIGAAAVVVALCWIALSGLVAGVGAVFGYRIVGSALSHPVWFVGIFATELLAFGIPEEIAWRSYFQNRTIAAVGGERTPGRLGAGIVVAAGFFAFDHVPNRLLEYGPAYGEIATSIGLVFVTTIVLGVCYELTRNVAFVALLHGLYNTRALLITTTGHAQLTLLTGTGAVVLALVAALGYRWWALRTDREVARPRTGGLSLPTPD